jgi:hypothetical protein
MIKELGFALSQAEVSGGRISQVVDAQGKCGKIGDVGEE